MGILITEDWLKELNKHPFHSSKCLQCNGVEKPGTGIFLMRERAKLVKTQNERKRFTISRRLGTDEVKEDEEMNENPASRKKKKISDVPQVTSS